jgi:hypothetical protein
MELKELIEESPCILPGHKKEFFAYLRNDFPWGIEKWLYGTPEDMGSLYQGDILVDVPVCRIDEDGDVVKATDRVAMISNTCDLQPARKETVIASLIFTFADHEKFLRQNEERDVDRTLRNIRENNVFSYFYLPQSDDFPESFIDFSTMVTIDSYYMNSTYPEKRVLSLSPHGRYLLLIKLTFHLARVEYYGIL